MEKLQNTPNYLSPDLPGILPERSYEEITGLASLVCNVPVSLIAFLDGDNLHVKSRHGPESNKIQIKDSFNAQNFRYLLESMVIPDVREDVRFKHNPLTIGEPPIVFYAGIPICLPGGEAVGALCVMDTNPRQLDDQQLEALSSLAHQVEQLLALHQKLDQNRELLQAKSGRLQNIIEATQAATWEWNVQTGEVIINDRWAEMIGYTKKELEPLTIDTWYKIVHPEDRGMSDEKLQACFDGKVEYYDIECRLVHKEGQVVWVNDRGKVVEWTVGGKPLWMAGTHTDITERKNTEHQFAAVTNNIPGVVFRYRLFTDGTDKLMMVSEGAKELWGVSSEEAMQNNQLIWGRYDDRDLRAHLQSIHKSAEELSHWEHEWRYQHPDGTQRWHKGSGKPTLQGDGSVTWDSVILDITDRKLFEFEKERAEQQLEANEKRFRALVENSGDAFVIIDMGGTLTYASPSFKSVLGYAEDEEKRLNLFELVHPEDTEAVTAKMEEVLGNPGKPIPGHTARVRHKDGSWRWLEATITNMLHDPAINGIVDNFRDVTDQTIFKKLDQLERQVMEASIDIDFELDEVLDRYLTGLEEILPDTITSILKIEDGKVWNLVSPSLPYSYVEYINGEPIGMEAGSCGKAAYTGKRIIVTDISTDPAWKHYRSAALKAGLKACWSQPIIDSQGKVVATFANYYSQVKTPQTLELEIFSRSASLISLIVESNRRSRDVLRNNELFTYVNLATRDAIYDWDIIGDHLNFGQSFQRIFGHVTDEKPFPLSHWAKMVHPDDRSGAQKSLNSFLKDKTKERWQQEYRLRKGEGTYTYVEEKGYAIRDKNGKAIRMIGGVRDITRQKSEQMKQKLLSEVSQFFIANRELKATLLQVLEYLVETGDFDLAEVWLTNRDGSGINLTQYFPHNHDVTSIYNASEPQSFGQGECLPGEVWESQKARIYDEIQKHPSFVRKKTAAAMGLNAALAIPLAHNNQVTGVILCATAKGRQHLEPYLHLLDGVSTYLAAEIDRKQMQEEMHLLFQSAPDILAVTAPAGYFAKVNPAFCKLLGYTEEELISKPYHAFIHPDDLKDSKKEYAETIAGKRQAHNYVNRLRTKDGHYRWISWSSSDVLTDDGHFFSYGRDITEVKELQNLLDNASQLARLGGWEVDLQQGSVYWSAITREIHEADESYIPDLNSGIDFYREDVRPVIRQHVENAIAKGEGWDLELPIITARGNERWIRTIGRSEFSGGKCVRLLGSFQDIHDRKTAEIRLQNTSDNIPGAIFQFVLHPDGTNEIMHLTKGAIDLWKYSAEQCMEDINLIWDQTKGGGDYEKVQKSIVESAQYLSQWNCKYRSRQPDGTVIWLEGYGTPRKLADGSILWDSIVIDISEKKELEELLERSSALARVGSWEINLIDDTVYWSDITKRIREAEPDYEPTLNEGIGYFKAGHDRDTITRKVEECKQKGTPWDEELQIITFKGNLKWIRSIGEAEFVDGKCLRIYGSFQDIHDRKVSELDLMKYKQVIENSQDAIALASPEGRAMYLNPAMQRVLGMGLDTLEKTGGPPAVYADRQQAEKVFSSLLSGQYWKGDVELIDRKDRHIDFHLSGGPVLNDQGELIAIYGIHTDMTERKKALEQIRLSNERFEKATEATNDAIWDWDIVNNTLYWGGGFQTLFGHKVNKSNVTLKSWEDNIHPDECDRVMDSLHALLKKPDENHWQFEYRYMKSSKEYVFVLDKGIVIRDENGKALRMVGAMSDITYRKEYEESLLKLNKQLEDRARALAISNAELEQFAYVASHDLQEPLRMVSSFLTQLDRKYRNQLDEKSHQYIHYAVDGARRMRQIILDLLEFSRVGKHDDHLSKIPLVGVIEEVKRLLHREIEKKGVQIHYSKLPVVASYKTPLLQVFQNLISNSIKYAAPDTPPEISIRSKRRKKEWIISVDDNGIGIEEEYFDKIFVIFQRLHGRGQYSGTGMGLALVKKNVELLGGRIWLESNPGKGSTFYFTIPRPS